MHEGPDMGVEAAAAGQEEVWLEGVGVVAHHVHYLVVGHGGRRAGASTGCEERLGALEGRPGSLKRE